MWIIFMRKINSHDTLVIFKNYVQKSSFPKIKPFLFVTIVYISFFETRSRCVVLPGLEVTDLYASASQGLGLNHKPSCLSAFIISVYIYIKYNGLIRNKLPSRSQVILCLNIMLLLTLTGTLTIDFISISVELYSFVLLLFLHACMNEYACLLSL